MIWTQVAVAAGLAVPAYFLWSLLHELSHILAAKLLVGVSRWTIKPWPQVRDGLMYWGYAEYVPERALRPREAAGIHLAPRALDLLGAAAFCFTPLFTGVWFSVWGVLFGAGLVDLVVGSLGSTKFSDLQRASLGLEWDPWVLRLGGFLVVIASVGVVAVQMIW